MPKTTKLLALMATLLALAPAICQAAADPITELRRISESTREEVKDWKYIDQDVPGAEKVDFDDSAWKTGSPEFEWGGSKTGWIRKTIILPEKVYKFPVSGDVVLAIGADDDGEVYCNGKFIQAFHWDNGLAVLTKNAKPGDKLVIAVKMINTGGPGRLLNSELLYGSVDEAKRYLDDYRLAAEMHHSSTGPEAAGLKDALDRSVASLDLAAAEKGDAQAFSASIKKANAELTPFAEMANAYTAYLVGHAHIDMNWLWLWPETVEVCQNTFTSVTNLMSEYPDFMFSQSQPSTYIAVQDTKPELFAKIKKAVADGKWEITGGTWTEGDMNMASGESIVRQMLYANRYFKETFGKETEICWEPDTFGHAWSIPQIMKKSGLSYYVHARCGPGPRLYWWQGIDGTRVLAYNSPGYSSTISPGTAGAAIREANAMKSKNFAFVYGVGDHGGGPTRSDIDNAQRMTGRFIKPNVKFSSVRDFFGAVEKQDNIPTINNELNFTFRGCYTTHSDIKLWNRKSENLLPAAEAFSTIANTYGRPYANAQFRDSWQTTCFNQFHDIFDGSAIHGAYDYSRDLFNKIEKQGKSALNNSLSYIAARADTRGRGIPVVVYNPLAWARTDKVETACPSQLKGAEIKVIDAAGRVMPVQQANGRLSFVAKDVPSMGYATYWIRRGLAGSVTTGAWESDDKVRIENEFLVVEVDKKTGQITSVLDKKANRQVLDQGKTGTLQALWEDPVGMSGWEIGKISSTTDINTAKEVAIVQQGPAVCTIRVKQGYKDSAFTQDISLYAGVPRVDIRMMADWQEIGTRDKGSAMIKTAFAVDVKDGKASFEIPFAAIERKANGEEVPGQKWIDVSNGDYGVSLLNDCKYGHDVNGSTMRLTLLRSSYDPDPRPDVGMHEMTYSLYPHKGDWRTAGTVKKGYELNNPLIAVQATSHKGPLGAKRSFLSVDVPNVIVTAYKRQEDNKGTILRFYESVGKATKTTFTVDKRFKTWVETDLLERPIQTKPQKIVNGKITVTLRKHDIRTLLLK